MLVKDERSRKLKHLFEIPVGGTFFCGGVSYIKAKTKSGNVRAVRLGSGLVETISSAQLVEPLEAVMHIHDGERPRESGQWKGLGEFPYDYFECSRCGYIVYATDRINDHQYCPKCGSRMTYSLEVE